MPLDPAMMAQMMAYIKMMDHKPDAPDPITIAGPGVVIKSYTNAKGQPYCVAELDPTYVDEGELDELVTNFGAMDDAQKQAIVNALIGNIQTTYAASAMASTLVASNPAMQSIAGAVRDPDATNTIVLGPNGLLYEND